MGRSELQLEQAEVVDATAADAKERELLRRREETYRKARKRNPQRWSRGIRDCSPAPAVTLNPRKKNNDVAAAA